MLESVPILGPLLILAAILSKSPRQTVTPMLKKFLQKLRSPLRPSDDCAVRQVDIVCKLYGDPMPAITCPACHQPMDFDWFWDSATVVLVEKDVEVPPC